MQCNFCSCQLEQIYKVRNLKPYCNLCYQRFVNHDGPDLEERKVLALEKLGTLIEKNNHLKEEFLEQYKKQTDNRYYPRYQNEYL
jgi:hypothetical protein